MTRHVVIGTAGHIDHGKTTLVRSLTGIETDRLAEEKRRGITIDLGFAHMSLPGGARASIVDVPGHEDFIRNMVAGAAGIDVALLVVAADEGVMPQTLEHLAILRMLDVPAAVVALTRADLVEPEWLPLATDDIRAHLAGTAYEAAPIVTVSARTGVGLDALLSALDDAAAAVSHATTIDQFRMPIDRGFTLHGTGTVVTGTVRDGELAVGDELLVLPAGRVVRVRGLQHHGAAVDRAGPGVRAAAALAGIDKESAGRGSWLASAAWSATSMLTVRLDVVRDSRWEIRQRQRVRLHIGTAEVMARVILLDAARLAPGESGMAQLRLESPVVARFDDRFVIRSYSPLSTIGGGRVLEPVPPKRRRLDAQRRELLRGLEAGGTTAIDALLLDARLSGLPIAEIGMRTGLAADATARTDALRFGDHLYSRAAIDDARERIRRAVDAAHRSHPLRVGAERSDLRRALADAPPSLVDALLDDMVAAGTLRSVGGAIAAADFTPTLDAAQASARTELEAAYRAAALAPPRVDELPAALRDRSDLRDLLALLEREGELLQFPPDRLMHREALDFARARLDELAGQGDLGPGDFKALFDLPRKHLIPLLELFDRLGWTRRHGDLRSVVRKSVAPQPLPGSQKAAPAAR